MTLFVLMLGRVGVPARLEATNSKTAAENSSFRYMDEELEELNGWKFTAQKIVFSNFRPDSMQQH
jgi:hypothetical protein